MRGEFIRGDGAVIPNNITSRGAERILSRAFTYQDNAVGYVDPTQDPSNFVGLGSGVYAPDVSFTQLNEPTDGVGGYYRLPIPRGPTGWAPQGLVNGEWYAETLPIVFAPTAPFSRPVTRLILTGAQAVATGVPWAVSSPFPEITLTPATPIELRTFRYRIYLR